MPDLPEPGGVESPARRQFLMLNARRQFHIPSHHQLLSDAYATLGGELERLRCIDEDQHLDSKQRLLVFRQTCAKAEALSKLVRALQILRQEERLAAAASVGGKPVDDWGDAEVLQALLAQGGPQVENLLAEFQERRAAIAGGDDAMVVEDAPQPHLRPKPAPYKRERGAPAYAVSVDTDGAVDD